MTLSTTLPSSEKQELLSTKDEDIQLEVIQMCDTLLAELHENLEYAEKTRKANEEYEHKVFSFSLNWLWLFGARIFDGSKIHSGYCLVPQC